MFADDVLCETRGLLRGCPGAKRLAYRNDVVVDGLGEPDNGQLVTIAGEERREIGRSGIGVVATDGVQHIDTVGGELVGRRLQWVDSLGDQTPLHKVGCVGELDSGISNGRSAEGVKARRVFADDPRNGDRVTFEQALIAVSVGDDLDIRSDRRVALDQPADRC